MWVCVCEPGQPQTSDRNANAVALVLSLFNPKLLLLIIRPELEGGGGQRSRRGIGSTWKALHFACGQLEAKPVQRTGQQKSLPARQSAPRVSAVCVWARPLTVIFDWGHISACGLQKEIKFNKRVFVIYWGYLRPSLSCCFKSHNLRCEKTNNFDNFFHCDFITPTWRCQQLAHRVVPSRFHACLALLVAPTASCRFQVLCNRSIIAFRGQLISFLLPISS